MAKTLLSLPEDEINSNIVHTQFISHWIGGDSISSFAFSRVSRLSGVSLE
jgi:hypothetical protein